MARRKFIANREQLTPVELDELRQRLAAMKRHELEIYYKARHNACAYNIEGRVPSPKMIQEFVQAWKELRKTV
jgi:hypothetical protein